MKLAVILGVLQMIMGVLFKGVNNIYFRDCAGFMLVFIPQLCFIVFIFGWMIVLIYIKWFTDWVTSGHYPNLINTLINMPLNMGSPGKLKLD